MDTSKRTILKAFSWQLLGLITMTLIAWCYTGSARSSFGLALVSAATSMVFYFMHERCWQHIRWGRSHSE